LKLSLNANAPLQCLKLKNFFLHTIKIYR
jgi:hypothetical protein